MPRRARGFTLIELLVVLAIIALAAALAAPALGRFFRPKPVLLPAEQLMTSLARVRDEAVRRQQDFRGFLDLKEKRLQTTTGQVVLQLPIQIRIEIPGTDTIPERLPCRFSPEGIGCAMQIRIVQEAIPWLLSVDPVTGRVRLRPEPPGLFGPPGSPGPAGQLSAESS